MINKYSGVTLIILAVVSLLASWMIYNKYTKRFYVSSNNAYESRQLIKDIAIKPEAFKSLKIMKTVMNKLTENTDVQDDHMTIALSPVIVVDERPLVTTPSDKEKQKRRAARICREARKMKVSMSFVADEDEYAVIAGKFVRIGQKANDFEVLSISSNMIKVKKQGVKCDIKVSSTNLSQL